jgi:hypothetical protein
MSETPALPHYLQEPRNGSNLRIPQLKNGYKKGGTYIYHGILSDHKKDEILSFATTGMELEIMM